MHVCLYATIFNADAGKSGTGDVEDRTEEDVCHRYDVLQRAHVRNSPLDGTENGKERKRKTGRDFANKERSTDAFVNTRDLTDVYNGALNICKHMRWISQGFFHASGDFLRAFLLYIVGICKRCVGFKKKLGCPLLKLLVEASLILHRQMQSLLISI